MQTFNHKQTIITELHALILMTYICSTEPSAIEQICKELHNMRYLSANWKMKYEDTVH